MAVSWCVADNGRKRWRQGTKKLESRGSNCSAPRRNFNLSSTLHCNVSLIAGIASGARGGFQGGTGAGCRGGIWAAENGSGARVSTIAWKRSWARSSTGGLASSLPFLRFRSKAPGTFWRWRRRRNSSGGIMGHIPQMASPSDRLAVRLSHQQQR
jgi:hypothetical protein